MTEGELLFTQILKYQRLDLYLNRNSRLNTETFSLISSVLKRRISGEPLPYILGKTEFMGLEFRINENVFIPRPETEILVETAIRLVQSSKFKVQSILDIGTGSGCIAVSLAKFLKDVKITAVDILDKALEIAKQNAALNHVEIDFLQSNLFANDELRTTNYELIISNPPYVPTAEIDRLQTEIQYEPTIAIDGGRDGLDFYRRIIKESPAYLKESGFLIMEMGFGQEKTIEKIFTGQQNFKIIEVVKDYNNIDRIIVVKLNNGYSRVKRG